MNLVPRGHSRNVMLLCRYTILVACDARFSCGNKHMPSQRNEENTQEHSAITQNNLKNLTFPGPTATTAWNVLS